MNISNLLLEFGLGESEIEVYLEALKREYFTAREVSEATGLKRPAVYYILASLGKKGFISVSGSGKIEKFKAEQPEQLLAIVDRQKHHLNSLEKKVKQAIPLFPQKDFLPSGLPNITYHRGADGMKILIEKVYKSKEKKLYTIMPSFKSIEPHLDEDYSAYYLEERAKRGIITKSIWQDLPSNKKFRNNIRYLRDVRIAPKSMLGNFNSMIDIFDNYVIISTSYPELFGLAVASYDYSQTMKAMWEAVWSISKPIQDMDVVMASS